jgi:hypothetical protein
MSTRFAPALIASMLSIVVGCAQAASSLERAPETPAAEPDAQTGHLAPMDIPAHPFLAANGRNGMHSDAWATDTHDYPGPLGVSSQVNIRPMGSGIGGLCATQVFDSAGHLFSVCTDLLSMRLVAMEPTTLEVLATHTLPTRPSNLSLDIAKVQSDTSEAPISICWLVTAR